jgi:hypothetical protein
LEIKLILPPRDPALHYLKKFDHPPMIKRGRELTTIDYNTGWVEHMSTYCDLHYTAGISDQLIAMFKTQHLDKRLLQHYRERETAVLGLVKQLVDIRRKEPFAMPLFGSFLGVDIPHLTCGTTRFTATVLAGQDLKKTPCIWQLPKGETRAILGPTTLITSTLHAEELCNLEQVEYTLGFQYNKGQYTVSNNGLRDSAYNLDASDKSVQARLTEIGEDIMKFWDRHRAAETNKIKITVACDPHVQQFVAYNHNDWDVTFVDLETLSFSFTHVLAEFANSANPRLKLELRDVTDRFSLEYLIPLVEKNKVWFHTQDKKLNLVDTGKGPASACWPIEIWGNLVK